jgi:CRISPR/Cas system CMR-associated protein Cmr1 (group 7 of RAMP superfamily)
MQRCGDDGVAVATSPKVFSVRNRDRGTTLATKARLASSYSAGLFGLMGRKGVAEGGGLLITKSASIHSFFMRFRFDAIFIDRENRVVKIVPAMRQWWVAFGGCGSKGRHRTASGRSGAHGDPTR